MTNLPPWVLAGIRTMVQAGVGWVVAWAATKEITVPTEALEGVAFAVITGVVTALLRLAEKHAPWLSRVLSLFLTEQKPIYVEPETVEGTKAA